MSGVGRASAILASGTMVSRLLGFLRTFALTIVFSGMTTVAGNAYTFSNAVPTSIYALIGGGLVSAVLVPQIIRASSAADLGAAYINKLVTIAAVTIGLLTVILTVAAPLLMRLYIHDAPTLAVAIPIAYWSLPQIFFLGMYAVLGEVLNARRRFGAYTWAPVVNNVVALAAIALFLVVFGAVPSGRTGPLPQWQTVVIAGGTTLGLAAQALVLALVWRRAGLSYRPDFRWRGVGLKATGQAAGWTFSMLVLTQVAGLIQTAVVSTASGDGNPSGQALQTAWLLFMLPHSIVTVSLVTVFYPRMSEHAAAGDERALRGDVARVLGIVLLAVVGIAAALIAAALPVTAVFSETVDQARLVAPVLVAYLIGLVPFTVLFVVQRSFYALADTRTPFRFTVAQLLVVIPGILLCALLPVEYIAVGIAAVVTVGVTVQLAVAWTLLKRRVGSPVDAALRASVRRFAIAGVPALVAGLGLLAALGGFGDGWPVASRPGGAVGTVVVAAVVLLVYALVLAIQRAPELGIARDLIRSRLRR
ncbi:murein biosynthesis integral membrane protein MurJ [Amnibacterium endophyticum]|uniref:Murein biosynthesis integral membrane protein MurJ n=1 Tax=Amnibacterium endophyticum TaxID=2109337 RepID=A0ABW4LAG7_9MICO